MKDLLRSGLEWAGIGVVYVLTAIFFVAFGLLVFGSHTVCVHRDTGEVRSSDWGIHPLDWFGVVVLSPTEACEPETGMQYLAGKVPVVGEPLEQLMGGPDNPEYYENR